MVPPEPSPSPAGRPLRVATVSLAGCFGCHMSLLDIDERLFTLAGHVHIGDFVIFGGLSAIHQFGRVGSHAFVGGCAALNKDVPPYVMAAGNYAKPFGVNSEGLRRRGFSAEAISAVKRAYKEIFRSGKTIEEVLPVLSEMAATEPAVQLYVDFLKDNERGIIRA